MTLEQNFDRAPEGTRQLTDETILTEFKLTEGSDGIYAKRQVSYTNYRYTPTPEGLAAFERPEKVIEPREAAARTDQYWAQNRPAGISPKETSVDQ